MFCRSLAAVGLSIILSASYATAGPRLTAFLNAPPMQIVTTYLADGFGNSDPVTFQVYGRSTAGLANGDMIRLRGLGGSADLRMHLTCGAQQWASKPLDRYAIINAVPSTRGWCTLTVSPKNPALVRHRDFRFSYQRTLRPTTATAVTRGVIAPAPDDGQAPTGSQ